MEMIFAKFQQHFKTNFVEQENQYKMITWTR